MESENDSPIQFGESIQLPAVFGPDSDSTSGQALDLEELPVQCLADLPSPQELKLGSAPSADMDLESNEDSPIQFGLGIRLPDLHDVGSASALAKALGLGSGSPVQFALDVESRSTPKLSSTPPDDIFMDSEEDSPIEFGESIQLPVLRNQGSASALDKLADLMEDSPIQFGTSVELPKVQSTVSATRLDERAHGPVDGLGNRQSSPIMISSDSEGPASPQPLAVKPMPAFPSPDTPSFQLDRPDSVDEPLPPGFQRIVQLTKTELERQHTIDEFRKTVGEVYYYHFVLQKEAPVPQHVIFWRKWSELHPLSRLKLEDILEYPEDYRDCFPFGAVGPQALTSCSTFGLHSIRSLWVACSISAMVLDF